MSQPLLPANRDLARAPVQIIELKRHQLARAEPQARQQQQDRVVAPPRRRLSITGGQESFHVLRRERSWQGRQPPVRHCRHDRAEIDGKLASVKEEPEHGPQGRRH